VPTISGTKYSPSPNITGTAKKNIIVVGFDGSPDVVSSILKNGIKATVLQPASKISEMAVDQADAYLKNGKADQPEKQSVDCVLVNPDNAKSVSNFSVTGS